MRNKQKLEKKVFLSTTRHYCSMTACSEGFYINNNNKVNGNYSLYSVLGTSTK